MNMNNEVQLIKNLAEILYDPYPYGYEGILEFYYEIAEKYANCMDVSEEEREIISWQVAINILWHLNDKKLIEPFPISEEDSILDKKEVLQNNIEQLAEFPNSLIPWCVPYICLSPLGIQFMKDAEPVDFSRYDFRIEITDQYKENFYHSFIKLMEIQDLKLWLNTVTIPVNKDLLKYKEYFSNIEWLMKNLKCEVVDGWLCFERNGVSIAHKSAFRDFI